ncbi:MAG: isopentenyl-diphosphate Delta-isomerase [Rhizobacter sp.]|nr:isopentenyl-diphosphate Delta-isomerase [Ferruginibacter sp.]
MSKVILVNEADEALGSMDKMQAHREGLLHRAFSIFIFNTKGDMLLQQRALGKYHSAGLWTNACCSHPLPGEDTLAAAGRRLQEEMGFTTELRKVFSFTYQTNFDNGLSEHEVDHVFTGTFEGTIVPDNDEVNNYVFNKMGTIRQSIKNEPHLYTSWFKIAFPKLETYLAATGV